MKAEIGIPDDSPESTVSAIKKICEDVAATLGVKCAIAEKINGLSTQVTIDFDLSRRRLRIVLSYIDRQTLPCAGNSFGDGTIFPAETEIYTFVGEKLELSLGCEEVNSKQEFQWRASPENPQPLDKDNEQIIPRFSKPVHTVDGRWLRGLLHERLSLPLPE